MIEWALIVLAYICALTALGAVVFLILDYFRDPPRWWVRRQVPDFIPSDWGRPNGIGGDRPQANPERDPAIERGIQDRRR